MEGLFTFENLFTLGMLVMLQAVLGFDNLLYISLESKRVEAHQQPKLRKWGIEPAVLLRILLLFTLLSILEKFTSTCSESTSRAMNFYTVSTRKHSR